MDNLHFRIKVLNSIQEYIISDNPDWTATCESASNANAWFTEENIQLACRNISTEYLDADKLKNFCNKYVIADHTTRTVGIVMAGNIPLVGIHDLICAYLCGYKIRVKLSSKDSILMSKIIHKINEQHGSDEAVIEISESLKGCNLYLATGSNSTMSIYGQYFANYPHLLRTNKTSVAVLSGNESKEELLSLMEDIHAYFGLGCRNVTKLYVPEGYKFEAMIDLYKVKNYFIDHNKYKNNYDYHLAIALLNKQYYMTDGHLIYLENSSIFSPIACLHYEYYSDLEQVIAHIRSDQNIQCHVGLGGDPLGSTQTPRLDQFADGLDTMDFLTKNY